MTTIRKFLGPVSFLALCVGIGGKYGWYDAFMIGGGIVFSSVLVLNWPRSMSEKKHDTCKKRAES